MSNTIYRFTSDRYRKKGGDDPLRRWAALMLVLICVVAAFLIFTRDIAWEPRRREARGLGLTAEHNGNYAVARIQYETALANHPYDWETHLSLANLLNYRLNDQDNALRHYLYALAYSPEPSLLRDAQSEVEILKLIRRGEIENPYDAIDDIFSAVESNAETLFYRRLSIVLRRDAKAFWEGWRKRGRGTVSGVRIVSRHDGFFDAQIELDFPDATSMSIHLYSPLRDIWRVELSFP